MQPPLSYEEHNLIQWFGSKKDLQQELDQNNSSDSSSNSYDSDDVEMFVSNPKMENKVNKFLNKVFRLFPDKYRSMINVATTLNDQTNLQMQHKVDNILSFEPHPDETNAQWEVPITLLDKSVSKSLSMSVLLKSTFEAVYNPLYDTTPFPQDQMVMVKTLENVTYPKTSQVLQSGSQSQMQEHFTAEMPNITDVQTNPMMQQSSYVHSSLVHATNTHSQMTQSLLTWPSIMATKRANSGTRS